jgi:hypothetical protein
MRVIDHAPRQWRESWRSEAIDPKKGNEGKNDEGTKGRCPRTLPQLPGPLLAGLVGWLKFTCGALCAPALATNISIGFAEPYSVFAHSTVGKVRKVVL